MDPVTASALITAGISLIGGLLGNEAKKQEGAQDRAFQEEQLKKRFDFEKEQNALSLAQKQKESKAQAIQSGAQMKQQAINNLLASFRR